MAGRTNEEWIEAVAVAWLGAWILIKAFAWVFGFQESEPLTEAEAREDAIQLAPIVRKHPTIARILTWIGAPVVIVRRIIQKFKRKPKPAPPAPKPANPNPPHTDNANAPTVRKPA